MIGFVILDYRFDTDFQSCHRDLEYKCGCREKTYSDCINRSYQLAGTTFLLLLW